MAPVLAVVLVVEYAGLWLLFRSELRPVPSPGRVPAPPFPLVPVLVVAAMLAGFAVLSHWSVAPAWPATAAALVLAGWALARRTMTIREVAAAAHPSFALLVLALGVAVAAVATGFLGDWAGDLVPAHATSYGALLGLAVLATLAAALLTNLSATLLLVPLVAPLGTTAVLATLLGLNIGSGLTWTGSLANLLWRRSMATAGRPVGTAAFHRVSLVLTPVSLAAGVAALAFLG
jgi:arsenical pump membrane protein